MAIPSEAGGTTYCGYETAWDLSTTLADWWYPGMPTYGDVFPSTYTGGLMETYYGYKDQCVEHRCNAWVVDVRVNRYTGSAVTNCNPDGEPQGCPFAIGQVRYDHPGHQIPKWKGPPFWGGGKAVLQRDCESFRMFGQHYVKVAGATEFTLEHEWDVRAFWDKRESFCNYYMAEGSAPYFTVYPPAYDEYDTHRVAVWAYGRDAYQQTAVAFGTGWPQ